MFDDPEMIEEFIEECKEYLDDMESDLLSIEKIVQEGNGIDVEVVNKIFRAIHSIKGAAGFLGFRNLARLTHEQENLLGKMRLGKVIPTTKVISILLSSIDSLKIMIFDHESSEMVDISEHIRDLKSIEENIASDTEVLEEKPKKEPETKLEVEPKDIEKEPEIKAEIKSKDSKSLRVKISILDKLMFLAGELVLTRNQLMNDSINEKKLNQSVKKIDLVTTELQSAIMATRMQSLKKHFDRCQRQVRDVASLCNKKVDFQSEGSDVELDKNIIEVIGDPLTHLVRNAIDHGIESPKERLEIGKTEVGSLKVSAHYNAGQVIIEIIDDGKGINPQKIKEKALSLKKYPSEEIMNMSDQELIRLVFQPGFSTAENVSELSGRGVGMDVVYKNLSKIGGVVNIESEVGKGSRVIIRLPLTQAIITALMVGVEDETYVIPQDNVQELVRIPQEQINKMVQQVEDDLFLHLRGIILPLLVLEEVLKGKESQRVNIDQDVSQLPDKMKKYRSQESVYIAIVNSGTLTYGILVSHFKTSEEIVIKSLSRFVKKGLIYSGATILGNGEVALILDIIRLGEHTNLSKYLELKKVIEPREDLESNLILICSNASDELFGIPVPLISKIEKINRDQICSIGGKRCVQFKDHNIRVFFIEEGLEVKKFQEEEELFLIIYSNNNLNFSLAVSDILDIVSLDSEVDHAFQEPGLDGVAIVHGNSVSILNLCELISVISPDLIESVKDQKSDFEMRKILLVEDSKFYRKQMSSVLLSTGYEIVVACDGKEALEFAKKEEKAFDLILTDIEMPNMDGFGLCQNLREDLRYKETPIVAMTSLTDSGSRKKAVDVGMTDYQLKIDFSSIMRSVQRLLY